MKNVKRGKIDISELNVPPEKHEYETAKYFADRGFDIVFIKPSDIKGMNSPDFEMDGRVWETKSPTGKSKRTLEDNLRKATKQSKNIIFDLRRIDQISEDSFINKLRFQSKTSKIKALLIITKDGRLLTIKGKFDRMWVRVA